MADLASIIQDMREYGTAGPDAYLGPNHMALCLKQQANIWADQLAALSHAAGQEATTNSDEIGRKSVDGGGGVAGPWKAIAVDGKIVVASEEFGNDVWLYVTGDFADTDAHLEYADRIARILNTPAQPPASAEVGRDAERYQYLAKHARQSTAYDVFGKGGHWSIGVYSDDSYLTFGQAIDAAMAASSGRKGGEL